MLDDNNILVKPLRMVRDHYQTKPYDSFRLQLLNTRDRDCKQYNLLMASEVAQLIIGDMGAQDCKRIEHNRHSLQRIFEWHTSFISLNYPLLVLYREDGFRNSIPYRSQPNKSSIK